MKILLITPTFSPDIGGVETMLAKFCDYLARRKFRVDVITYNPLMAKTKAPFKEKLNEVVTVWRIPWIGYGLFNIFERYPLIQFFYLVPALTVATLLFIMLNKQRPEIIHAFGLSGAFAGGFASRLYRIPCIVDMCTVYRFPRRKMLARLSRVILDWSSFIRANNPVGRDEIIKTGIKPNKVGIISPPVDELIFKPVSKLIARKKVDIPKDRFVALFVGRMVNSKNVEIAIGTTYLIKYPNILFIFIGEGPLQQLIEKAAEKDERIRHIGSVPHEELVYYYNAADILLCAAVDAKLLSFVAREALMCGLPLLAPNVGIYFGLPYRVSKNLLPTKVGKLLEPAPEAFADYIKKIIKYKEIHHSLPFDSNYCRQFAVKIYSNQAIDWLNGEYERILREVNNYQSTHKLFI